MTIEERLEVLERELAASRRYTRRLWVSLGLAGVVCVLIWSFAATTGSAQAQGAMKVIRANKFVVEDENGKECAVLGTNVEGPALLLSDVKGVGRAVLATGKNGPGLILQDEKGVRAVLATGKNGPGLILQDEKGVARAMLATLKDGPSLRIYDVKGVRRAMLGTGQIETPDGITSTYPESSISLFGPDSTALWSAP